MWSNYRWWATSYKEDFSDPLEGDHIGINSEFFEV